MTKTRLIPALGATGAAQLSRCLVEQTLAQAAPLQQQAVSVELWFTGASQAQMQAWLGDRVYRSQPDGDLGDRMAAAFAATLPVVTDAPSVGVCGQRAVLIGTDCPDLTTAHLVNAFAALADHDLVLGPAQDGGYYLIGLQRPIPALFTNIPWGTATVAQQTLSIAAQLGLVVHCLPVLGDIDRPADLAHPFVQTWATAKGQGPWREGHRNLHRLP